jgi:DNA-3-methyladenine glycosylase I
MSNSSCWVEGPGGKPQSDDKYFERLTRVVFQAGMNWRTIDAKWSGFQEAFLDFSIKKVADFTEEDVERLLKDKGIVCNRRKILATIANAKELEGVVGEYGSVSAYIDAITESQDLKTIEKELISRFHHLGPMSADIFLLSVGVPIKGASSTPWISRTRYP